APGAVPAAVRKPFPLAPPPVPGRPVQRAEVDDPVGRALLPELRVAARDVEVGDADVAVAGTSEDDPRRCGVVSTGGVTTSRSGSGAGAVSATGFGARYTIVCAGCSSGSSGGGAPSASASDGAAAAGG